MPTTLSSSSSQLRLNKKNTPGSATADAAWDLLDHFVRALQKNDKQAAQIRLTLETIRKGVKADIVFWFPGQDKEPLIVVGESGWSAEWCHDLVQKLVAESPGAENSLVRSFPESSSTGVRRVAMVRMSRSRGSWLVAAGFSADRQFGTAQIKMMSLARRLLQVHRHNLSVYNKLRETMFGLVRCLTATIDARDPCTWGHSERVARMAVRLGQQMQLSETMLTDLYLAGILHDIGKVGIADRALQKPGKLTPEEYTDIQKHTLIGDELLSNIPSLRHLRPGVRNHHEHFDGSGYPDKLAGMDIPLLARIIAVADACDAMMSDRPYRAALQTEEIDRTMAAGAGKQWDAEIMGHFMACRGELYSICQRGLGRSMVLAVERTLASETGSLSADNLACGWHSEQRA